MRKPSYTRKDVARMICDPKLQNRSNGIFKQHMTDAFMNARPNRNNHDELLKDIARARLGAALKMGDPDVVKLIRTSPVMAPHSGDYLISTSLRPGSRRFDALYHLAMERLVEPKKGSPGFTAEGGSGYTRYHLPNGNPITTNSFAFYPMFYNQIDLEHISHRYTKHVTDHLREIWEAAHRAKTLHGKLAKVAEYQWWFYQANPTNRGGASCGDTMSALLLKSLDIPLEEYEHRDWDGLTLPLGSYLRRRTAKRLGDLGKNPEKAKNVRSMAKRIKLLPHAV